MPRYLVSQKVRTVANVNDAYAVNEFTFTQFEPERGLASDAWEARSEVVANNFRDAFSMSRQVLLPLVDAISVVTQSAASLLATSHFVYRLEQNDDRLMFLYVARRRGPVGMPLGQAEQVRDIQKLLALPGSAVNYLREANNASTAKTQLAMLVIAAEALAGQKRITGTCKACGTEYAYGGTDKEKLRAVLGDEAFYALYVKDGGSLRNLLFHGKAVPGDAVGQTVGATYRAIRTYLQKELGLESFEEIVGAPRTFDSFEHGWLFVRLRARQIPSLRDLEQRWETLAEIMEGEPPGY